METKKLRAVNSVMGALVADAAAMGLHWLYDQDRIFQVAGVHPEFRSPNRSDYGDKGYFAYAGKKPGEPSQYGAQLLAMCDALGECGQYQESIYIKHFRQWFDFGGCWQGYIDKPTRQTLLNTHRLEAEDTPLLAPGADDTQLPALSKLAPLIAVHHGSSSLESLIENAVRVTNNNDEAVEWGQAAGRILALVIDGAGISEAVEDVLQKSSPVIAAQITLALSRKNDTSLDVAREVGMHCGLSVAFTVIIHLLLTSKNYPDTIRQNILCGGDSCGRGIFLGAVLGAYYHGTEQGIPRDWLAKVTLPGLLLECV